jgi:hypothetical protein
MTDDSTADQPGVNRIIPHNLTAQAAYNVAGNPPTTRPESGVANCYPGLEYDHRNLDCRFFPGLLVTYIADGAQRGIKVVDIVPNDPALRLPPDGNTANAQQLATQLNTLATAFRTGGDWFVTTISQGARITLTDDSARRLDGETAWRMVRSLRPGPVTIVLDIPAEPQNDTAAGQNQRRTVELTGWRRTYTDPHTGVIDSAYQPGELSQSLCSPWTHDFRDCSCTYWASNHPDIVLPAIPAGQTTQPGGAPLDPKLNISINWLRNPDFPDLHAQALPTQQANRAFEASYYQINQRWQDLAIVLEGRETGGVYIPRSTRRDHAQPFADTTELVARLTELAGLEHLVAVLYLYARFSVKTPAEAAKVTGGSWPTLQDDVEFTRSILMEVAVGEMQHLRAVNTMLWDLAQHRGLDYQAAVIPPAKQIPVAGQNQPATLAPLTPDTLELFVNIERFSGFIDGQYARATATLKQPGYPPHLFELASTVADEGEQHFLDFRDIQRALAVYGDPSVYLRDITLAARTDPRVAPPLKVYENILELLVKGYHREQVSNQRDLAEARKQMFDLQTQAEDLAAKGIGIPFLSDAGD